MPLGFITLLFPLLPARIAHTRTVPPFLSTPVTFPAKPHFQPLRRQHKLVVTFLNICECGQRIPRPARVQSSWYSHFRAGRFDQDSRIFTQVLAEEKPGSIRFCSPLLLYISEGGNRLRVGLIRQVSSRRGSTQSTMRVFSGLKNMLVAIIKSTKVHLGLAGVLGVVILGESVHVFNFLFF